MLGTLNYLFFLFLFFMKLPSQINFVLIVPQATSCLATAMWQEKKRLTTVWWTIHRTTTLTVCNLRPEIRTSSCNFLH